MQFLKIWVEKRSFSPGPLPTLRSIFATLSFCAVLFLVLPAHAHVGSPDVYTQGDAGPYKLFIVVRPPLVIPGVAEIQVRAQSPGVESITAAPMLLTGEASKHPPVPDALTRSQTDPQMFTGRLWIMATGSWQVRFTAGGTQGEGVFSVPLPATAQGTRKMSWGLGFLLGVLGVLLVLGVVGMIGAEAREAQLEPGQKVSPERKKRAYVAMSVTFVLLIAAVVLGGMWWRAEAADYSSYIYKPLIMKASVQSGNVLDLRLKDPGWLPSRKLDDFVPDHNHLMHLYAIRWPEMDVVYHVHPQQTAAGDFQLALPDMAAGTYHLYADVVHANGFPETLVSTLTIPALHGRPLSSDDSAGTASPIGSDTGAIYKLPDGYTMVWKRPAVLKANAAEDFTFELLDPNGQPPKDMALYMGMEGHAAFVKTDGTVFAHIHPTGTVAMAALMMADAQNPGPSQMRMDMPGMDMSGDTPVSNTVSFPYGFPKAGSYRIFVQMKHGDRVETGTFDASVQ